MGKGGATATVIRPPVDPLPLHQMPGLRRFRAMRVLAIDPGVSGAMAVVSKCPTSGSLVLEAVHDLPTNSETTSSGKTRRSVDPIGLTKLVKAVGIVDGAVVEKVFAPPGIASTVAFSLGATKGTILSVMALAKVPVVQVTPNTWKQALEVPPDKAGARRRASAVFGSDHAWPRVKDHNRAEAALIGAWGLASGKAFPPKR